MRSMCLALFMVFAWPVGAEQAHWSSKLRQSYVQVVDGEFRYQEQLVCNFDSPTGSERVQLQFEAMGPADAMSRDHFIGFVVMTETTLLLKMASLNEYRCASLEKAIGTPDLVVTMTMTGEGFQIRAKNNESGESKASTGTWAEVYANP